MSNLGRAALVLGLWVGAWAPALATPREAHVARVLDGLTLETSRGETVRLAGLHLFEFSADPALTDRYQAEARAFTAGHLQGKAVRLEADRIPTDPEGRLWAYAWIDDALLNEELLRAGLAEVRAQPPNLRHYERLVRAQREAVQHRRGAWGDRAAMDAYAWTPGGVVGRAAMPLFYHPADPELDRLPFGERRVYFDSPAEAIRRGWAPSFDYARWAGRERDRLVGGRPRRTGILPEIRREAESPPPAVALRSTITSVSGPEVFGLADRSLVRLDGIEVVPEGRALAESWQGQAVEYVVSGPASLGVRPVLLWVEGRLAQAELVAQGLARLSARADPVFGAHAERLRRLEAAARAARLGAWGHAAPRWTSSYVAVVPPTPARAESAPAPPAQEVSPPPAQAAPPPRPAVQGVVLGPPGVIVRVVRFLGGVPILVQEVQRAPAPPPAPPAAPGC